MMESPFYRSHWGSSPRYPQIPRHVPIATPQTTSSPSHKPKVVSIPVHFIHPTDNIPKSNPNSKSDSAIRIQKQWRGFRVRKSVKKLLEIQRELHEVESTIVEPKTVEAIRTDERERLKVSERLMSLLFRLDSIRGFNAAVRDLRKALIRRAIVLQEKVDSIAVEVSPESKCDHQESDGEDQNPRELQLEIPEKLDCEIPSSIEEGEHCKREEEPVEKEVVVVKEEKKSNAMEESKRNREDLIERMVEENNRLMTLMADLFERNEMQTRILSSLSERVGQLENASACEKFRRRAKKQKKSRNSKPLDNDY